MNGARQFADYFETGQYGRFYIVSGRHARGKTFHIYILPEGSNGMGNGPNNPPLNSDAVEVYGVIGGNPGWTESYGWLHHGKWEDDFANLVAEIIADRIQEEKRRIEFRAQREAAAKERMEALLAKY
jgi:hypothetical protein